MSAPYKCKDCGREMFSLVELVERWGEVYCKECDRLDDLKRESRRAEVMYHSEEPVKRPQSRNADHLGQRSAPRRSFWQRLFGRRDPSLDEVPIPSEDALLALVASETDRIVAAARPGEVPNVLSGFAITRPEHRRVLVIIGRHSILAGDTSIIERQLEQVIAETIRMGYLGNLLQFTVDGYTLDVRELWDIPEVVSFFGVLHEKCPYLPYWLGKESLPLYVQIVSGGSQTKVPALLKEFFLGGNKFCELLFEKVSAKDPVAAREAFIQLASARISSALGLST